MGMPVMAIVGMLSAPFVQPAYKGPSMPVATLSGTFVAPATNVHPFLLTNQAKTLSFLKKAYANQTGPTSTQFATLTQLQASVAAYNGSADSSQMTTWLNPPSSIANTNNAVNYQVYFAAGGVLPSGSASGLITGAATVAQANAWYAYLCYITTTQLASTNSGTFCTGSNSGLAATALSNAEAIVSNWAAQGFQYNGVLITDPLFYTNGYATTSSKANEAWSGIGLNIGRGMRPYVQALDFILGAGGTVPDLPQVTNFIQNQENLLVQASNVHYAYDNNYRNGMWENQTANVIDDLLNMATFTGNWALVRNLAGDPAVPRRMLVSFPQWVEGAIYGVDDNAVISPPAQSGGIFYNQIVALGEITDRIRAPATDDFGYTAGGMVLMMNAGSLLKMAGYSPFTFTGPSGSSLKAAIDYYSQYGIKYGSVTASVVIPSPTAASPLTIPDESYYVGSTFGGAATGGFVMGNDGRWDYALLASYQPEFATDTYVSGLMAKVNSLATSAYIPGFHLNYETAMQEQ